jgi:hypothetical protein
MTQQSNNLIDLWQSQNLARNPMTLRLPIPVGENHNVTIRKQTIIPEDRDQPIREHNADQCQEQFAGAKPKN